MVLGLRLMAVDRLDEARELFEAEADERARAADWFSQETKQPLARYILLARFVTFSPVSSCVAEAA